MATDIKSHKNAMSHFSKQLCGAGTPGHRDEARRSVNASVALSTKSRQDGHSEFVTVTANNAATSKLLQMAINRLDKFYELALLKAAPKVDLSGQDRIFVNRGGEITTAAPAGIAGTDVERVQLLQEPVAETITSKFEKSTDRWCRGTAQGVDC